MFRSIPVHPRVNNTYLKHSEEETNVWKTNCESEDDPRWAKSNYIQQIEFSCVWTDMDLIFVLFVYIRVSGDIYLRFVRRNCGYCAHSCDRVTCWLCNGCSFSGLEHSTEMRDHEPPLDIPPPCRATRSKCPDLSHCFLGSDLWDRPYLPRHQSLCPSLLSSNLNKTYTRLNSTKTPASGAGNVSEPMRTPQTGKMQEIVCS
jgi:hypothetical protein